MSTRSHSRRLGLRLAAALAAAVVGLVMPATQPPASAVATTVYWNQVRQNIDGFGAASDYFPRYLYKVLTPTQQDDVMRKLFSPSAGAGFTIVRNRIWDDECDRWDCGTPDFGPPQCTESNCDTEKPVPPSNEFTDGVWNFTCPSSGAAGPPRCTPGQPKDDYQLRFWADAKQRNPNLRWMFSIWSAPSWMKRNGSTLSGGCLKTDSVKRYANYLAYTIEQYKVRYGITTYAISPQNEPGGDLSWAQMDWKDTDSTCPVGLDEFTTDYLRPSLQAEGVGSTKVITPEWQSWRYHPPGPYDIVGMHTYQGGLSRPIESAGKPVWMTEFTPGSGTGIGAGVENAKLIHRHLAVTGGSAWLWWRYVTSTADSTVGDPEGGLFEVSNKRGFGAAPVEKKTLWTTANYSRFIRPNWNRINVAAASPGSDVYVSAYRDYGNSDKFAIVVINDSSSPQDLSLTLSGFPGGNVTRYRTSGGQNLADSALTVTGGTLVDKQVPAQTVTTYVGGG